VFFELQANPLAYPVVYKTLRRFLLSKFPYNIFYLVEEGLLEDGELGETIVVFACFHAKRDPKGWQGRIG
jgi:toxin ParE1/3/4